MAIDWHGPLAQHPDYSRREIPRDIRLGAFRLKMLTENDLDDDMAAIEESLTELEGIFGAPWPRRLTRAQDRTDLERHRLEFEIGQAFAWAIRDGNGAYLGCAYVRPRPGIRGQARVAHWFRTGAHAQAAGFSDLFHNWLRGPPWPRMEMTIIERP